MPGSGLSSNVLTVLRIQVQRNFTLRREFFIPSMGLLNPNMKKTQPGFCWCWRILKRTKRNHNRYAITALSLTSRRGYAKHSSKHTACSAETSSTSSIPPNNPPPPVALKTSTNKTSATTNIHLQTPRRRLIIFISIIGPRGFPRSLSIRQSRDWYRHLQTYLKAKPSKNLMVLFAATLMLPACLRGFLHRFLCKLIKHWKNCCWLTEGCCAIFCMCFFSSSQVGIDCANAIRSLTKETGSCFFKTSGQRLKSSSDIVVVCCLLMTVLHCSSERLPDSP